MSEQKMWRIAHEVSHFGPTWGQTLSSECPFCFPDLQRGSPMMDCPATREAVAEHEDEGEPGCPLCGQPSGAHPQEAPSS